MKEKIVKDIRMNTTISILVQNTVDYDVILFGGEVPEGDCDYLGMLEHPQCVINAFFVSIIDVYRFL